MDTIEVAPPGIAERVAPEITRMIRHRCPVQRGDRYREEPAVEVLVGARSRVEEGIILNHFAGEELLFRTLAGRLQRRCRNQVGC